MISFLKDAKDIKGGKSKHSLPCKAIFSHIEGLKKPIESLLLSWVARVTGYIITHILSSGVAISSSRHFSVYWFFCLQSRDIYNVQTL